MDDYFKGFPQGPQPKEMHPFMDWRPYAGMNLRERGAESFGADAKLLVKQGWQAAQQFGVDLPVLWHFHGAKPWDFRCLIAFLLGQVSKPSVDKSTGRMVLNNTVTRGENRR